MPFKPESCVRMLCALPPAKNDSGALDLELYPGSSLPALMRQTWAFEGFLQDCDFRWSAGPVYNVQSLRLVAHLFIQEHLTDVDREGTISFDEQPKLESRDRY